MSVRPSTPPTASGVEFHRLDADLRAAGIDTSRFAFYDQSSTMPAEDLRALYAHWVQIRPRSAAYDAHVRDIVPRLCERIIAAFHADNWHGGCVEASTMMSRMLDRLGIWSFSVLGSTTFDAPSEGLCCGFYKHDFQDFQDAVLGHAWLVVPPYIVVDATVALQQWGNDPITRLLPPFVAAETARQISPHVSDVVSWRMRGYFDSMDGHLDEALHLRLEPDLLNFGLTFPAVEVEDGPLKVRYVPVQIYLPECPLEAINENGEIGRSGGQIWEADVKPEFS
ncbi:hypothetical protein [Asticcacaulis sp. 201]|uniref:hypothetical protein n=1 Tax=Asticcacaulis sp. 201 TaxID=3028787 RepID=UPI002917083A|nr:hypothetical protein [Asticcacaulis sp. 201]MDV6329205.1 hypothetical protein [Asticcacaulis sp. 201]